MHLLTTVSPAKRYRGWALHCGIVRGLSGAVAVHVNIRRPTCTLIPTEVIMFRQPRKQEPDAVVRALADVLRPAAVYPWSNMAMHYLGVPIIVSVREMRCIAICA